MAYAKKGIYHFRTPTEYGIDLMPLNRAVFVESTGNFYSLSSDAGLSGTSTVQDAIDNGNLISLDSGGGTPPATTIKTDTPILTGSSNADEGVTTEVIIKNYQPEYTYTVNVSMGEYTQDGDTIKWSLPRIGTDTMMVATVSALKQDQLVSETTGFNLFVLNSTTVADQNFVLDAASMSDGICSTINASVVSGELVADDNLGDIQDAGYTSTTDVVYIDNSKVDVEVGDTIKTDSETFRVGTVSNDGTYGGNDLFIDNHSSTTHTLFFINDGMLYFMGNNLCGISTGENVANPTLFEDSNGYITDCRSVSGDLNTVFVLKNDGTLWVIGKNASGQFGNGTTTHNQFTFTQVNSDVAKIQYHGGASMILKNNGTIWGTGVNGPGGLAIGSTASSVSSWTQEALNKSDWVDFTVVYNAGTNSWAVDSSGKLYGCGENENGQVGDGTTTDQTTFTQETSSSTNWKRVRSTEITSRSTICFALKTDGTLWGSGDNNYLEGFKTTPTNGFKQEKLLDNDWVDFNPDANRSIALKSDGTVWTAGTGSFLINPDDPNYVANQFCQESTRINNAIQLLYYTDSYYGVILDDGTIRTAGNNVEIIGQKEWSLDANQNKYYLSDPLADFNGLLKSNTETYGWFKKYWVNPETPLAAAPTNCYLQNHKAVSCYITQDQADRDWKAFNNASLTEIKVNSIGTTTSTTTQIYLNSSNIEAKLQDKFVTDTGEIFSVKEIVESPNYYVVPEVTLINVPTAVYALTTVSLNEVPLIVDSVNIGADLTHTFKDGAFNKTRAINFKFSLPDSGKVKTLSSSLEKLG